MKAGFISLHRYKIFISLFVAYSLGLLYLTVYPRLHVPIVPSGISADKLAHSAQFFIFSCLYTCIRIYPLRFKDKGARKAKLDRDVCIELFLLGALVSSFTESLQIRIPGRSFCWYDMCANLLGFYLFIICYKLFRKVRKV